MFRRIPFSIRIEAATDQRVERVLHRGFGEVATELGEQRGLLAARERGLLVEELDDVLPHGVQAHPLLHQDRRGDRALLAQDAEQHVLGADVVVEQTVGFFGGALQHPLRLGAERHLHRGRDLLAEDRAAFDLFSDVLQGQVGPGEDTAREPLPFADQTEQQVLGFDRHAAKLAGLVTSEKQHPARAFRVPFEHQACLEVGKATLNL